MSKVKEHYEVSVMDADGNVTTTEVKKNPPLKGETFEYEKPVETAVGQVVKVVHVAQHHDGTTERTTIGDLGDEHHPLEKPSVEDTADGNFIETPEPSIAGQ